MLAARETFVSIASIESPSSSRIPATCAPAEPPKKGAHTNERRARKAANERKKQQNDEQRRPPQPARRD